MRQAAIEKGQTWRVSGTNPDGEHVTQDFLVVDVGPEQSMKDKNVYYEAATLETISEEPQGQELIKVPTLALVFGGTRINGEANEDESRFE